jgi:4-aminobutyrate aminotransferase/diaminobutyrate-pyruvate transaminase/4-aminobutyrate aminotransferase/(S)-3-amino-2-methylpropionate transaminase
MKDSRVTGGTKKEHRESSFPFLGSKSKEIVETLARYEPRALTGFTPVVWDRAEGYRVFDIEGNCWIDFTSAIILANVGHAHERIRRAIQAQIESRLLHSYCFPTEIRALLVQKLVETSPDYLDKVFLLTTGSEAVEAAIKLTRIHGRNLHPEKIGIASFTQSFHGRTLGSQMLSGFPDQKEWIVNLDPDMYQIPFPFCFDCPWGKDKYAGCGEECFEKGLDFLSQQGVDLDRIAGFFIETFQGPTVAFMPTDYAQVVRRWADEHQALVNFDEIQAAFGRTGKMFGFEHYGVEADLVCCGKAITGSLPLSAVMGRSSILDLPDPGQMSSSHTGNPACCAAALANVEVIESEGLVERSFHLGKLLETLLRRIQKKYPDWIGFISAKGLVAAVYITEKGKKEFNIELADSIVKSAIRKGLLLLQTGRGTLKIAPPLSIPEEALTEGIHIIDEAIGECTQYW